MNRMGVALLVGLLGSSAAALDLTFQGKTLTMIVGFEPGGGTDAFARLAASFLASGLPGTPTVVVRNVPGAEGVTAMNYVVQQVAPDGLTVVTAASTTADPLNYRKPQAHFDPTAFEVIGGVGRGGSALIISTEAEKRLYDRKARPVVMGSPAGIPRSGMQMTAWGSGFLGWNTKWVVGYRGTNELMLALERGEIDMTSTANLFLLAKLLNTGRFKILVQTGTLHNGAVVPRPDFGDAPILANLLQDRISDPQARAAFGYWTNIASMDKWLALPPKSPPAMLNVYRETYGRMIRNPEFIDRGKKTSDDFVPLTHDEVEPLIHALGNTPPGALSFLNTMFRKQGLSVE